MTPVENSEFLAQIGTCATVCAIRAGQEGVSRAIPAPGHNADLER